MKALRLLLLMPFFYGCSSSGNDLQYEDKENQPQEETSVDEPKDKIESDEGTGTKVEYEKDNILYTFKLLNENGNADNAFFEGERICFCFSVTNNTDDIFPYDYRDIDKIAEFGVIYNTENDEYVGKAYAYSTDIGQQDVPPGKTSGCCVVYPFSEPETYSQSSELLKKGRYYTRFEGDLPCETFVVTLPEFRIDFVVE